MANPKRLKLNVDDAAAQDCDPGPPSAPLKHKEPRKSSDPDLVVISHKQHGVELVHAPEVVKTQKITTTTTTTTTSTASTTVTTNPAAASSTDDAPATAAAGSADDAATADATATATASATATAPARTPSRRRSRGKSSRKPQGPFSGGHRGGNPEYEERRIMNGGRMSTFETDLWDEIFERGSRFKAPQTLMNLISKLRWHGWTMPEIINAVNRVMFQRVTDQSFQHAKQYIIGPDLQKLLLTTPATYREDLPRALTTSDFESGKFGLHPGFGVIDHDYTNRNKLAEAVRRHGELFSIEDFKELDENVNMDTIKSM